MPAITPLLIAQIAIIVVVFHALLLAAAGMVWVERRLAAALQQRHGPTRVGWQNKNYHYLGAHWWAWREEG